MRQNSEAPRAGSRPNLPGSAGEGPGDEMVDDPLAFETVILPARLESGVARRVAIASDREGVSIADMLGRAAAAYDWQVDDERVPPPKSA
jgi:hypothetical protein